MRPCPPSLGATPPRTALAAGLLAAALALAAMPQAASAAGGASAPTARPSPCRAPTSLADVPRARNLLQVIGSGLPLTPDLCTSLHAVLTQLFNSQVGGGRKLEKDKAPDPHRAAAEYAAATAQADFAAELSALLGSEAHPVRRRLIEAALLQDFGKFEARDHLLRQLELP